jgi:recombination protein RecR
MTKYPIHLIRLIYTLRKLPGVGTKSAERYAFFLVDQDPSILKEMAKTFSELPEKITFCKECGCMEVEKKCPFCISSNRDTSSLCILHTPKDAFAMEETHEYTGLYHVLGRLLSPIDNFSSDFLPIDKICERIEQLGTKEVIFALDSTIEADATALYLKERLSSMNVTLSRLAYGLPMGSALDFVDGGTLGKALAGRSNF